MTWFCAGSDTWVMAVKQCSWDGCESLAAYGTRTKPAWCDEHITALLRLGGLEPLELFVSATAYRLTRCLKCGCVAHYRFVYTLDKNRYQEPTCRACYWAQWVIQGRQMGALMDDEFVEEDQARAIAESHGYGYLGPSPLPPSHRVKCRYCGRISVERRGDIGWGCTCQVNPRRRTPAKSPTERLREPVSRLNPELVEQWDPTLNKPLRVETISPRSKRRIHWHDPVCGHDFSATPAERDKHQRLRCPVCRTILDSLAWHYPNLADEWSANNPLDPWHVRPTSVLAFVPEWDCPDNPDHHWHMATSARVNGSTCPQCRQTGKSMIELRYFEALRTTFGEAVSGLAIRHPAFKRRTTWVPDITIPLNNDGTLLVEYDGSYWHANKTTLDRDKSKDLLAANTYLVRLRETPLPSLDITSTRYLELTVSATTPDPEHTATQIHDWIRTATETHS